MRAISALPILLFLTGCGPSGESEADLSDCHKAASRAYPDDSTAVTGYQKSCMASKGYHFSAIAYGCGRGDLYADAACYAR